MKQKLLFSLVLLLTATTGAWAQDAKHLITATYDKQTLSLEQPLPYETTVGALYEAFTGESFSDLISTMSALEKPLKGIGSNNPSVVSIGELNDASTTVTVNADGKAAVGLNFSGYVLGIFVTVTPPLYVTMKDGTKDADKWTVKVGEGQAQALPIGGLKGDGSETVTLQYNGRLKVKGVKATSDAAPAAGKTVDLSTYTGDSYEVTEDVTFTGTTNNEISILYKGDGYEVTLDNVNAPKCYIAAQDDYYNINVKLKGTSRLRGIYTQNADIIIGEAAAGGTVILVDEDTPLGSSGTTITINGGTVKAKTSSYTALYDFLVVNGGAVYLEAGDGYSAVNISASGSVTLYGWNGSAWESYSDHRYLSTDNSKAPSEWTW